MEEFWKPQFSGERRGFLLGRPQPEVYRLNDNKTKEQLIQELEDLRRRMAELEKSETARKRVLVERERSLPESEERFRPYLRNPRTPRFY